jgi:hypothetical protein
MGSGHSYLQNLYQPGVYQAPYALPSVDILMEQPWINEDYLQEQPWVDGNTHIGMPNIQKMLMELEKGDGCSPYLQDLAEEKAPKPAHI